MPIVPSLIPSKITQLPAATVTQATDLVPIVQDGVTKRASLSLLPSTAAAGQFFMNTVADGTIPLLSDARYAGTIEGLFGLKTSSGTVTAEVQIDGVAVTGLSAIAVTSVAQDVLATALRSIAVGSRVTLVLSANAAGANLEFTMGVTRG